jgi:hypothetical protein
MKNKFSLLFDAITRTTDYLYAMFILVMVVSVTSIYLFSTLHAWPSLVSYGIGIMVVVDMILFFLYEIRRNDECGCDLDDVMCQLVKIEGDLAIIQGKL